MDLSVIKVLVVDDVNSVRLSVQELLKSIGVGNVVLAPGGQEAKALLKSSPVTAILSDLHMFPTDGLDLLKFCKGDDKLKGIPFLMFTADNTKETVVKAVQGGVSGFLIKPVTAEQLKDKLSKLVK